MDGEEEKRDGQGSADQSGTGNSAGTTGNTSGNSGNEPKKEEQKEKTFTQQQVTAMMTKEKKQGREAAYREMGIDPEDSKIVSMFKAFIESQKTDEQKVSEQNAQQAAKIAEAEQRALVAEAKAEAMQLGVLPQYVDDAVTLVLSKSSGKDDIKSIVGELKTKYPVWFNDFSSGEDEGNKVGQKGTGASINKQSKGSTGKDGVKGIGERLATQRKTTSTKKSFWS